MEFENSAIKFVEGDKSAAQVAHELDLLEWQVQTWVREAKKKKKSKARKPPAALLESNEDDSDGDPTTRI